MTETLVKEWRNPRPIVERIEVTGRLELQTPTHFGSGDPDPLSNIDMTLLRDPLEGNALLTGASIAGALRNYLREVEIGYAQPVDPHQERTKMAVALFGGSKGDDEGTQSLLIVDDAFAEDGKLAGAWEVELRDGVRIEASTRTATEGAKFDMELLPAGTTFQLDFELLVPKGKSEALRKALAKALHGFESGEITLGARKRRGLGRCRVDRWTVKHYHLTEPKELIAWLKREPIEQKPSTSIAKALGVTLDQQDKRNYFEIEAMFSLASSMLVRSGFGESDSGPDMVHLHAIQPDGSKKPILPGTSLAGAIRHRALRIANTLRLGEGETLIDDMFGSDEKDVLTASRVVVSESVVQRTISLVQNRVKIDRFTGGAYETALFNEQPIWDNGQSQVKVQLSLRNPRDHEIGLLLLVLKDMWTGDLPVGGESSVGRGQLKGIRAKLKSHQDGEPRKWEIQQDQHLQVNQLEGTPKNLQTYVNALKDQPWEENHEA